MTVITGTVGRGGVNRPQDVRSIQTLLNNHIKPPLAKLNVDGQVGPKTMQAIEDFQRRVVKMVNIDGRVDPGGNTLRALDGAATGPSIPKSGISNFPGKPNWITIAQAEIGMKEKKGSEHNPRIVEYHSTTGNAKDDETAWCSSFVNWVMKKAGHVGTNSAAAVSWAKWGKKLTKPAYGAIAVIDWDGPGPGWKGHVGFVVGMSGGQIQLLGGNQSDQVKVSPFGTGKVIAYVVPSQYEVPDGAYSLTDYGAGGVASDMASTR
jgi:uncharacterized protein (TIGR02594 family)